MTAPATPPSAQAANRRVEHEYRPRWWYFGAPWAWPRVTIKRRPDGYWSYSYRGRKSSGFGCYWMLRDALRCSVGAALGLRRWGWRPGWHPNGDNLPVETDDWSIYLDCGHVITRTYMHSNDLNRLPTDLDGETMAYCPEHGFERVWFTAGVLGPEPWYEGEPGMREFGWRRPVAS